MKKLFNKQATRKAFSDMRKDGVKITKSELVKSEKMVMQLLAFERETEPEPEELFC